VVFPTHNRLAPMRASGLLAPLRHEWLPELKNLDARFRAPAWDAGLEWGVPYMWNGTGIVYQKAVQPRPERWADLWNPVLKGRMTMLDDPEDMLGACLKKLGLGFSATDPGQLARAGREAIAQKPLLRAYLNAEVRDQLVAGDVLAAQLWSTTAQQAMDAAPQLEFVYPAEGFPFYCDCAAILRESGRVRLAHQFLNYLLRPEVSAKIVTATRTATANGRALDLLPESVRRTPGLYPPPEVYERGEWPNTLDPATVRLRDRIWTEIKAA
jgi:spermidine/putrescine transport system substrate-binding protein